jgi:WD40 repeat protein
MNTAKCKQTNSCPVKIFNIDLSDSEVILCSTHLKFMKFWNTKSEKVVSTIENAHNSAVTCARFTPDENYVISTGHDHTVKVWDVRKWQEIYKPSFEHEEYTCPGFTNHTKLAISPNSQFVVVGSQNGTVFVLDIKKGQWKIEEIHEDLHSDPVVGCEWQPRGSLFATIDRSGGLYVWKD